MTTPSLQRILYVEDDDYIREVAAMALEAVGGFEVLACSSGREALEAVAGFLPDLMLIDVMMPEWDGPATLERLRQEPVTAKTPVVFFTAKVLTDEVDRLRALGALDVIAKPFDSMRLAEQLASIWRRWNERSSR